MAGSFAKISGHGAVLDTAVLDRITAQIRPKASKIVTTYGWKIASEASVMTPKDTTALEQSILTYSHPQSDMTFVVQDGVEYGVYQEFGTSKMGAHPFLRPAIEKWAAKFQAAFSELFK